MIPTDGPTFKPLISKGLELVSFVVKEIRTNIPFRKEKERERNTHTFLGAHLGEAERCLVVASARRTCGPRQELM
jgi:hypothetical protein